MHRLEIAKYRRDEALLLAVIARDEIAGHIVEQPVESDVGLAVVERQAFVVGGLKLGYAVDVFTLDDAAERRLAILLAEPCEQAGTCLEANVVAISRRNFCRLDAVDQSLIVGETALKQVKAFSIQRSSLVLALDECALHDHCPGARRRLGDGGNAAC